MQTFDTKNQNDQIVPSLSVDDLELSEVDVYGLTSEEALGVPELGASYGTYGCCTCCPCPEQ